MKQAQADPKWHNLSPIFNNFSLLTGNIPFSFPHWKNRGVYVLKDLYGDSGLRAFNDLKAEYDLPGSSYFFYLQLRSVMQAYGVPWGSGLPTHPLNILFFSVGSTRGIVSKVYKFISEPHKSLPVEAAWRRDISAIKEEEICWDTEWVNVCGTSKNRDHQLIHHKLLLGCTSPQENVIPWRSLHLLTVTYVHLTPSDHLSVCNGNASFWKQISHTLSDILEVKIPLSPTLLLLNDSSSSDLSLQQKCILWAGLTSAKKMLALRWQPLHSLTWQQWANSLLDIVMMEQSVARMHGASHKTHQARDAAYSSVKEKVQHDWFRVSSISVYTRDVGWGRVVGGRHWEDVGR